MNQKIQQLINHLENLGILKVVEDKIEINAEHLQFGTADDKALYIQLYSEPCKISMVHILSDKNILHTLRSTINKILEKESKEIV